MVLRASWWSGVTRRSTFHRGKNRIIDEGIFFSFCGHILDKGTLGDVKRKQNYLFEKVNGLELNLNYCCLVKTAAV